MGVDADATRTIEFSAEQVTYDSGNEVLIASGAVRMARDGNYLAADRVVWDRRTGEVRAEGNVVVLTPEGDRLVGDSVVLTDELRDGTVQNLLVVLESGGRIAARSGARAPLSARASPSWRHGTRNDRIGIGERSSLE